MAFARLLLRIGELATNYADGMQRPSFVSISHSLSCTLSCRFLGKAF